MLSGWVKKVAQTKTGRSKKRPYENILSAGMTFAAGLDASQVIPGAIDTPGCGYQNTRGVAGSAVPAWGENPYRVVESWEVCVR
jgi:hypothetical protein